MRKIIISVVGGVIVLAIAFKISGGMAESKKNPETSNLIETKTVFTKIVKNKSIPISITTSGSLLAKNRMSIFSEVQGVFTPTTKLFKAGETYQKGEALIKVNNDEFQANVMAQRSAFKSIITGILPDIQFDYPTAFPIWKTYLRNIDVKQNLPELPEHSSEKEDNYMTSKNIKVTYYNIKNLETRLQKYTIYAPYSGVLVDASITFGSLVSPGQKLGEFIQPNLYELELNVNANLQEFLSIGKSVKLTDIEHTKTYQGKVSRINGKIDRASQTIKIFVEVRSNNLKEGEYLEANITANKAEEALEIPRSLLINNSGIYIVKDNTLYLQPINIFYSNLNTVVIKNLQNGTEYVSKSISDGFEGMKVKIAKGE